MLLKPVLQRHVTMATADLAAIQWQNTTRLAPALCVFAVTDEDHRGAGKYFHSAVNMVVYCHI